MLDFELLFNNNDVYMIFLYKFMNVEFRKFFFEVIIIILIFFLQKIDIE